MSGPPHPEAPDLRPSKGRKRERRASNQNAEAETTAFASACLIAIPRAVSL